MSSTSILDFGSQGTPGGPDAFQPVPTRISNEAESTGNEPIPQVVESLAAMRKQLLGIHRVCAEACATQNDYTGALTHITCAVSLEPEDTALRNQQGFLRYLEGEDGAIEDFRFVLERDPTNADAWFNLGMCVFGEGATDMAEQAFAKAVEFRSDDAENWNNLGVARFQLGRGEEARQCFQKALEIDPEYDEAKANLVDLTSD